MKRQMTSLLSRLKVDYWQQNVELKPTFISWVMSNYYGINSCNKQHNKNQFFFQDNSNTNNQNFFNNANSNMNMNMVTMAMGRYFSQLNDNQSILKSAIKNCAKTIICKSANFSEGRKSLITKLVRYYDNYYLLNMFINCFFFFYIV